MHFHWSLLPQLNWQKTALFLQASGTALSLPLPLLLSPIAKKNVEKLRQLMAAGGASENTKNPNPFVKKMLCLRMTQRGEAAQRTRRIAAQRGKKEAEVCFSVKAEIGTAWTLETLHFFAISMSCLSLMSEMILHPCLSPKPDQQCQAEDHHQWKDAHLRS